MHEDITRLLDEGFTHRQIKKKLKVSLATISKVRKRHYATESVGEEKQKLSAFFERKEYKPIDIQQQDEDTERTAFLIASDWHIEERVRANTIHGLNEFDVSIAKKRASAFFANAVTLIRREQKVGHVVLALAGDFISGYIHEELEENNELSPTKALWEVYTMLRTGIEYLNAELEQPLTVACVVGNHGRTTQKRRISTAVDNSFEWLLYRMLEESVPGVTFNIAEGKMLYMQVYGKTIRLTHGDQIRGGGGIGGIYPPILRKIAKWDNSRSADLTLIGHFHQLLYHTHFVCNGSLVGFNPFAEEIGASPEDPAQAFFLFDEERGKISMSPIFLQ